MLLNDSNFFSHRSEIQLEWLTDYVLSGSISLDSKQTVSHKQFEPFGTLEDFIRFTKTRKYVNAIHIVLSSLV